MTRVPQTRAWVLSKSLWWPAVQLTQWLTYVIVEDGRVAELVLVRVLKLHVVFFHEAPLQLLELPLCGPPETRGPCSDLIPGVQLHWLEYPRVWIPAGNYGTHPCPFNLPWQLLFYIIKALSTAIHTDTTIRPLNKHVFTSEWSEWVASFPSWHHVYAVMMCDVVRNAVALTQHKECVHEHPWPPLWGTLTSVQLTCVLLLIVVTSRVKEIHVTLARCIYLQSGVGNLTHDDVLYPPYDGVEGGVCCGRAGRDKRQRRTGHVQNGALDTLTVDPPQHTDRTGGRTACIGGARRETWAYLERAKFSSSSSTISTMLSAKSNRSEIKTNLVKSRG